MNCGGGIEIEILLIKSVEWCAGKDDFRKFINCFAHVFCNGTIGPTVGLDVIATVTCGVFYYHGSSDRIGKLGDRVGI